jgi:hypothetical protein
MKSKISHLFTEITDSSVVSFQREVLEFQEF